MINTDLPTIINNSKFISFITVLLIILLVLLVFLLLKDKIKKHQRFLKQNYIVSFIFVVALIFSMIFLALSNFQTIGKNEWLTYAFYFSSGITSIILTIIFLLAIFLLPFRYIYTIAFLLEDPNAKKRIMKITFFYVVNASVAILVTTLCYFLKNPFFEYDFQVVELQKFGYTKFYYYSRYIFNNFIMKPSFSFYFIIGLIILITVIFIVLVLLKHNRYHWYVKTYSFSTKFIEKFKWQDKILPLFVFTATSSSLLSQPLATLLHICLILILFLFFSILIGSNNLLISYIKFKKYLNFKDIFNNLTKTFFKPLHNETVFNIVFKNNEALNQYKIKKEHTYFYKLLSVCIFPIIITGYLGFCSTGPLLFYDNPWYYHLWFWISLFTIPYFLGYAYIFSNASASSCKLLMNMSTAYITSGFNSGILIYFNPIINKISQYAIFSYQLVFLDLKKTFQNHNV